MITQFGTFSTRLIEATGQQQGPISPPLVNSAAFGYGDPETAEGIFDGSVKQPLYARMGNPTTAQLESALAVMDGGVGAVATASGMGAATMVAMALMQSGDEVISVGGLFGGTYALFSQTLVRFGITTHYFDTDDFDGIRNAIGEHTKLIFCESVGNPNMRLSDIETLAQIATEYGIALAVDNTATPLSLQPLARGADIVLYSTTKLITGNASALGGAAVFRAIGAEDDKFRTPHYAFMHRFIEKMGKGALIGVAKKRGMRDLGMSPSAFNSYLTLLGLQTLPLRMERITQSAEKIARALAEAGADVNHPALSGHPHHARLQTQYNGGCGPFFTVDLKTQAAAYDFLRRLKRFTLTANIGDVRSLTLHMGSTIYSDFNDEEKAMLGITPGLVRLSIGLENPEDLIRDLLDSLEV